MRQLSVIAVALVLAGCATAEVASTQNGVHTLRVEGSRGYNRNHADDALARKASDVCPDGFDVLDRSDVGPWRAGDGVFAAHPAAYEWRVTCR